LFCWLTQIWVMFAASKPEWQMSVLISCDYAWLKLS